ncbi:MAG: heterodisulfide reductase [Deltaproteobacteria bacterium]|nr:MAG: heterodisulfide reductase [Deltaproteobacteria bacterium]
MEHADPTRLKPSRTLAESLYDATGINVADCFQCRKCTNGCPATFAMDIFPDQIIRLLQLGQEQRILNCSTIWICSACETCTTRCPNGIDIAGVMDFLKERAVKAGIKIPQSRVYTFHSSFLNDIRRRGRVFEGRLMLEYMIRSGEMTRKLLQNDMGPDMSMGWNMFKKGRMPLLPKGIKDKQEIKKILS